MTRLFSLWFAGRGFGPAALLVWLVWRRAHTATPLCGSALWLVALGLGLRVWAGAHLGPHGNAISIQAPTLVRSGPYRWLRHPLYASNLGVVFGVLLFANCLRPEIFLIASSALALQYLALAGWEDRRLRDLHGAEYAAFAAAVPAWPMRIVPARLPTSPAGRRVAWRRALSWQGRNLVYAVSACLLIWGAAVWR